MKKYNMVILVIVFIVPSIAFASWWNPFTWKIFNSNNKKEVPIQTQKIIEPQNSENRIIEKQNPINDLNNKNNQLPSIPTKESISTIKNKITNDIVVWRTFTNTTYNYQFKYPQADYYGKDDTIVLNSNDPTNIKVSSKKGLGSAIIFSVKVIPNITNTEQFKTVLDAEASPFKSIQAISKLETVNITIGGINGLMMTDNYLLNTAGVVKDKQAYIFKSYNEFELEPYKKLLSTFEFVKPTETVETKIIKDPFAGVDCGRGKDNGFSKPQPEIDCFFTNMISCSNAKIILGEESGYADDILISVKKVDSNCILKAETSERTISCKNKMTKTAQEIKEKIESAKTALQEDRFLAVFGIPIVLGDKISKGDSSCTKIEK